MDSTYVGARFHCHFDSGDFNHKTPSKLKKLAQVHLDFGHGLDKRERDLTITLMTNVHPGR